MTSITHPIAYAAVGVVGGALIATAITCAVLTAAQPAPVERNTITLLTAARPAPVERNTITVEDGDVELMLDGPTHAWTTLRIDGGRVTVEHPDQCDRVVANLVGGRLTITVLDR